MTTGHRRALRSVQLIVALLLVALAAAGRSERYWPLVTWPVYGTERRSVPGDSVAILEVRVLGADGTTHRLRAMDLVEWSRHGLAENVLAGVASPASDASGARDRAHLVRLVEWALPHVPVQAVEVWRIQWSVDPTSLPALRFEKPDAETLVARVDGLPMPVSQ